MPISDCEHNWGCALTVFVFVSLAIGLPTFLFGCETNHTSSECIAYRPVHGIPYHYNINRFDHSKSIGKSFNSFVQFKIVEPTKNSTCHVMTSDSVSEDEAREAAEQYRFGTVYSLYRSRYDPDICTEGDDLDELWNVGVFFLSMAGCCFAGLIGHCCGICCKSNLRETAYTVEFLYHGAGSLHSDSDHSSNRSTHTVDGQDRYVEGSSAEIELGLPSATARFARLETIYIQKGLCASSSSTDSTCSTDQVEPLEAGHSVNGNMTEETKEFPAVVEPTVVVAHEIVCARDYCSLNV